jgi:hypothetical protein
MPDAARTRGFGETNLRAGYAGSIIQMVRLSFGRIDFKEEPLTVYFAHK